MKHSQCKSLIAITHLLWIGMGWSSVAEAQQLLWTRERSIYDDWYGSSVAIASDLDGDGLADVGIGGKAVDCSGVNDGMVQGVVGWNGTERFAWCGDEETAGSRLVAVRDVDGDGVGEFVASSPFADDTLGGFDCGRILLLSGVNGAPVWALVGEQPDDHFGSYVEMLGDIDGDGFDEVLVSAADYSTLNFGRVYVVSTKDARVIRFHDGPSIGERLGVVISTCDDVDGDLIADYAILGRTSDFLQGRIDLYSGASGALLWSKLGAVTDNGFGGEMAPVGDWDGDGRGDLAVYLAVGEGILRIYSPALDQLLFEYAYTHWRTWNDDWGKVLQRVPDCDGDGIDELAIAATRDDSDNGRVDLCSGRTLRPLYRFQGDGNLRGWFGMSMAAGGDLDGDGIDDLVVGAPLARFRQPKGGKVFAYALNDLFLQAEPPAPLAGDTVAVDLRGAPAGQLGLIALTAIDGVPLFEPLLFAPFDSNGELQFCADIDASVSGMEFTLMGYAPNKKGRGPLVDASPFVVSVQ